MLPASTNKTLTAGPPCSPWTATPASPRRSSRPTRTASPGWWCSSAAATRCSRRPRPARRPGTGGGADQRPGRPGAPERHHRDPRAGGQFAVLRPGLRARLGSRRHLRRGHRPDQAVMVDAGRTQPTTDESRRSTTPALDAGRALAGHCGSIRRPSASPRVRRPGSSWLPVRSAPLIERLRQMMLASDNVMAETIGRGGQGHRTAAELRRCRRRRHRQAGLVRVDA